MVDFLWSAHKLEIEYEMVRKHKCIKHIQFKIKLNGIDWFDGAHYTSEIRTKHSIRNCVLQWINDNAFDEKG